MPDGLGYVQAAGCECGDGSCGEVGGRPGFARSAVASGLAVPTCELGGHASARPGRDDVRRTRPGGWLSVLQPAGEPCWRAEVFPEVGAAELPPGVHRRHGCPLQRLWGELSGSGGRCPAADARLHPKDAVGAHRGSPTPAGSCGVVAGRVRRGDGRLLPGVEASQTLAEARLRTPTAPTKDRRRLLERCGHRRRDREGTEFRAPSAAVRHPDRRLAHGHGHAGKQDRPRRREPSSCRLITLRLAIRRTATQRRRRRQERDKPGEDRWSSRRSALTAARHSSRRSSRVGYEHWSYTGASRAQRGACTAYR